MRIYDDVLALVGHTPLIALRNLEKAEGLSATVCAKAERFNPAGSTKDRAALYMILDAEERGLLTKDSVIIEPTSGNTGIGIGMVAAVRGYRVILTMPETMSIERCKLLAAYGAEIVLTDGARGMTGAIEKANELAASIPHAFIPGQFENPANAKAHEMTTGPEIWEDTDGRVDIFVAGVGTGGTITGVGRYLKKMNPNVQIVAVEPTGSPVLSGGAAGAHGLQGIGAGFIPDVLDRSVIDEVMTIGEEDAYAMGRFLAKREGLLVGITSGAAVYAATLLAKREENRGKLIVALLPDSGERYLSTPMFAE